MTAPSWSENVACLTELEFEEKRGMRLIHLQIVYTVLMTHIKVLVG